MIIKLIYRINKYAGLFNSAIIIFRSACLFWRRIMNCDGHYFTLAFILPTSRARDKKISSVTNAPRTKFIARRDNNGRGLSSRDAAVITRESRNWKSKTIRDKCELITAFSALDAQTETKCVTFFYSFCATREKTQGYPTIRCKINTAISNGVYKLCRHNEIIAAQGVQEKRSCLLVMW